ncbi:MAG: hypothetical protein U0324_46070 [Polyangiales bacterium]
MASFACESSLLACALSPDGSAVLALLPDGLVSYDLRGAPQRVASLDVAPDLRGEACLALSPDGERAVVALRAGDLACVDLASGRTETLCSGASGRLTWPRYGAAGELFALRHGDAGALAWVAIDLPGHHAPRHRALADDLGGTPPWAFEWRRERLSPDGSVVLVEHSDVEAGGIGLLRWAPETGAVATTAPGYGELVALDDRRAVWEAGDDGALLALDLATLAVAARWPWPDDRRARCGCFVAGGAVVLGLDDGRVLRAAPR